MSEINLDGVANAAIAQLKDRIRELEESNEKWRAYVEFLVRDGQLKPGSTSKFEFDRLYAEGNRWVGDKR